MSHVSLNVIQIYHVITNNSDATKLFYCSHIYFKVNNLYIIHIYKCTCSITGKACHPSLQILHHMTDASHQSVFRTETQLTQVSRFQLNVLDFRGLRSKPVSIFRRFHHPTPSVAVNISLLSQLLPFTPPPHMFPVSDNRFSPK